MKNTIIIILIIIVGFSITANIFNWNILGGMQLLGSGNVITKDVEVSDFNKISLSGMGNLILEQGGKEGLRIEAEDNIMDKIIIDLENDTLNIGFKKTLWITPLIKPTADINYYVSLKEINGLRISGSGTATGETINTDNLDIAISGSGKINLNINANKITSRVSGSGNFNLSGKADSQKIEISGSGKYFGKELESKKADIRISGSGKTEINASEELDINVSGSGSVFYVGKPTLTQRISGSGKIEQIEEPETSITEPASEKN